MDYMITIANSTTPLSCEGYECLTEYQIAVFLSIYIFISLVGIAGNILVILSVVRTRSLQNHNNAFLTSLAVADLLMTTVGVPLHAVVGFGFMPRVDPKLCLTVSSLVTGIAHVTIFHITAVAFDRFLAVTSPLTYNQRVTNTRVGISILGIWLAAALLVSISLAWDKYADLDNPVCDVLFVQAKGHRIILMFIPTVITFTMMSYWYICIFRIARGHRRQIRAIEFALEANGPSRVQNSNTMANFNAELRAAVTLIFILGFFVFAMSPGAILIVLDSLTPISISYLYVLITTTTLFSNSAINPFIYAARNKDFRKAFVRQLKWICPCTCCKINSDADF